MPQVQIYELEEHKIETWRGKYVQLFHFTTANTLLPLFKSLSELIFVHPKYVYSLPPMPFMEKIAK